MNQRFSDSSSIKKKDIWISILGWRGRDRRYQPQWSLEQATLTRRLGQCVLKIA